MTGDNVKIAANWQFLTNHHGPYGREKRLANVMDWAC